MARVHTLGIDERARALNLLSEKLKPRVKELLDEGGRLTAEATRGAAYAHGLIRTGQMAASIDAGNEVIDSDGARLEVWPKGSRRGRGRNAEVGFVQHYGRSYGRTVRAPTGFFDEGFSASEAAVQAAWERGWSELMDEA